MVSDYKYKTGLSGSEHVNVFIDNRNGKTIYLISAPRAG